MNEMQMRGATSGAGTSRRWRRAHWLLAIVLSCCGTSVLAVPMCTVGSGATLSFGAIVALASTGDVTANSGSSFWVNCTSDVAAAPALYSATSRTLESGANSFPFALSGSSPGGPELPAAYPGMPLGIAKNGSNQTVTLYGKVYSADFKTRPSGHYSRVITLTVEY